jgi:hypothetical protein
VGTVNTIGTPGPFSTVSSTPYFGRAWKIEVITSSGVVLTTGSQSFSTEDESLKVIFDTYATTTRAFFYANISIYNLNQSIQQGLVDTLTGQPWTGNDVIQQANVVTLFAGYQSNFAGVSLPYGMTAQGFQPIANTSGAATPTQSASLIFAGQVFQPLWERMNVTDYKVTLHCLIGLVELSQNFVAFAQQVTAQNNQVQILQKIAAQSTNGIKVDSIDDLQSSQVATTPFPRGRVVWGRPGDYLDTIASSNYQLFYLGPNGINVRNLEPPSGQTIADFTFGPPWPPNVPFNPQNPSQYTPTIIGTPQQTQDGVVFRVLMDSRVKLGSTVALDFSGIKQLPQYPLTGQLPSILSADGTYVVCAIRHVGDTRGDDWYTEITAVNKTFWPAYVASSPLATGS